MKRIALCAKEVLKSKNEIMVRRGTGKESGMDDFEKLLNAERVSVERFVRFRLHSREDADDVLQEVYLAAYQKFAQLKNRNSFKYFVLTHIKLKTTFDF